MVSPVLTCHNSPWERAINRDALCTGYCKLNNFFLLYSLAEKYKPCLSWILSLYYVTVSQYLRNLVGSEAMA